MMLHLNNLKLKNYSLSFLSAAMMVQYDTQLYDKLHLKGTRALQPVATCRQSPYLRPVPSVTKPAILIMTSLAPRPALQTYDTLPRLIYRDAVSKITFKVPQGHQK